MQFQQRGVQNVSTWWCSGASNLTYRVHLHARAKVCQLQVAVLVEQHVVRFDVTVDEAHGVDGIQRQHHLGCVETSPLLGYVVVHGESDHITARHELHHHVEVAVILECAAQLENSHLTSVNALDDILNGYFRPLMTIRWSLIYYL